ncbi:hypothetical protein VTK26DRAFT_3127 [Humicola hyalothermophila]
MDDAHIESLSAAMLASLSRFSPLENEQQLACVYEGLWRLVTPAFNDIVQNDIEWAAACVGYACRIENANTEALLSRGLENTLDIAKAEA